VDKIVSDRAMFVKSKEHRSISMRSMFFVRNKRLVEMLRVNEEIVKADDSF
jgi:hypothetical protein